MRNQYSDQFKLQVVQQYLGGDGGLDNAHEHIVLRALAGFEHARDVVGIFG